jgi:uncharacterized membrane protein
MLGNGHVRFGRRAAETDQSKDRHRAAARPHTKLHGPAKWTYFYLYAILAVYSRKTVGRMVASRESSSLAEQLLAATIRAERVPANQLTIHADRGSSMASKPVALLLADLGGAVLLAAGALTGKTHQLRHVGALAAASTWQTWAAFAFLVVPGSVLAYGAFVWLLAVRPVQLVATYAYVNPVIAVALGSALLGEHIDLATLAGAALVLTSVAAVVQAQPDQDTPPSAPAPVPDTAARQTARTTVA